MRNFQAARDKWLNAKERRQTARIGILQDKLSQAQDSAAIRDQNFDQEIRRGREEKEREVNFLRQESRSKEEELSLKLAKLSEEYDKLKSNMVSTSSTILFCVKQHNGRNITNITCIKYCTLYNLERGKCRLYTKYVKYRSILCDIIAV